MSGPAEAVLRIVEQGGDADDVLRSVVESLAAPDEVRWAGIAFVEGGALRLGPSRGQPDEARRQRVAIDYEGSAVGQLWVDGDARRDDLEQVADLIAPYVLIGWDTGGETWDP